MPEAREGVWASIALLPGYGIEVCTSSGKAPMLRACSSSTAKGPSSLTPSIPCTCKTTTPVGINDKFQRLLPALATGASLDVGRPTQLFAYPLLLVGASAVLSTGWSTATAYGQPLGLYCRSFIPKSGQGLA